MLNSVFATGGIVTAPHHLAADAGRDVLRAGGNAVEAMIAMAAAIPVVYPHMNAIGGDSFWIVKPVGKDPVGIDACGAVAANATDDLYRDAGFDVIPRAARWRLIRWRGRCRVGRRRWVWRRSWAAPKSREYLLEAAIHHAERGFPATGNQSRTTADKLTELRGLPGYDESFLLDGMPPAEGISSGSRG